MAILLALCLLSTQHCLTHKRGYHIYHTASHILAFGPKLSLTVVLKVRSTEHLSNISKKVCHETQQRVNKDRVRCFSSQQTMSINLKCWTSDSAVHKHFFTCTHVYKRPGSTTTHTKMHGCNALPHPHTKGENRDLHCDAILRKCDARSPVNATSEQWRVKWRQRGELFDNCVSCIINMGVYTYLMCSADLCKHTSGCSANKSRLYCPLTSAELLIVNVTQLQRRASTVDWGSLSLTSWLTAANAPHVFVDMKRTPTHHKHSTPLSPQ